MNLLGGTRPMVRVAGEVSDVMDMRSPLEGPDVTSKDKVLISAQPDEQLERRKSNVNLIGGDKECEHNKEFI